jgi:hypothetical protein
MDDSISSTSIIKKKFAEDANESNVKMKKMKEEESKKVKDSENKKKKKIEE